MMRIRQYSFSIEFLAALVIQDAEIGPLRVILGVPATAILVGAYCDNTRRLLYLQFEDESFEYVREGDIVPNGAAITVARRECL